MIRTIRMLLSAAVIISVLSSGSWSISPGSENGENSTQALNTQTVTRVVPQPTPTVPSTKISTKAPRTTDNNPSTQTIEKPSKPSDHEDEKEFTYVLNKNTRKFHYPDCRSVGQMKPSNKKIMTASREYILDMGYVACKICNP